MSSVNFKTVKNYTKVFLRSFLFSFFYFVQVKVHALEIDMSRRGPASAPAAEVQIPIKAPSKSLISQPQSATNQEFITRQNDAEILKALKKAVLPSEPTNEIVILNTETGFIPEKVRVRKGESYKVHIVNLNMKEKNVSFLMDSFTQSHNTVYGVKKTFNIDPQVEGIYSYQCPETGIQGQMIVVTEPNEKSRRPSSVSNTKDFEE